MPILLKKLLVWLFYCSTAGLVANEITKAWRRGWAAGGEAGWLGALLMATFYSMTDITLGIGGIILFVANIILLAVSIVVQKIGEAVVDFIRWLCFWCD